MTPELSPAGRLEELLAAPADPPRERAEVLGLSRQDRPVLGWRLGNGPSRVSLIGGCHADEPVGPHLLRRLVTWLDGLSRDDPLLDELSWWVVPHANPDGEARNLGWYREEPRALRYGAGGFAAEAIREAPGDDVEFGFPRGPEDGSARPENRAIAAWWGAAGGPFRLHVSLHGMAVGAGPWFLLEEAWADRTDGLRERCRQATRRRGYRLHDDPRRGEKGFRRLDEGFSTRPDSRAMRDYFLERGDEETAARFRPSSMETVRAQGGDALTAVSEMPLFLAPPSSFSEETGSPAYGPWKDRLGRWRAVIEAGERTPADVAREARDLGLRPMPVRDQMALQWTLIAAGLEATAGAAAGSGAGHGGAS